MKKSFYEKYSKFYNISSDENHNINSNENNIVKSNEDLNKNKYWYVIQTETGREEILIKWLNLHFTEEELKDSFVVKRETRRKINGEWKVIVEKLFKGYVFVVANDPVKIFLKLKNIPMLSKLLADGEYTFLQLNRKEIEFISKFGAGRNDHTAKISTIDLNEGDEIEYIGGDLAMFAGQIKRIDKHKRRAVIEVEMFGRKTEVYMGFDFLKKKEK